MRLRIGVYRVTTEFDLIGYQYYFGRGRWSWLALTFQGALDNAAMHLYGVPPVTWECVK